LGQFFSESIGDYQNLLYEGKNMVTDDHEHKKRDKMLLMKNLWVLSAYTVKPLFKAKIRGSAVCSISLNLGVSMHEVRVSESGLRLPDSSLLTWPDLNKIQNQPQSCFAVEGDEIQKIEVYSDFTDRYYSLYPTQLAPTMLISGIPMHRIKDTDPSVDTLHKIRAVRPTGIILDTATGLGYTAIEAAKSAEHIITVELDPAVIEICRLNPWSQKLFTNSNITQHIGDSFDVIQEFPDSSFSCIIHDPPTFSLAGDLYSSDFYSQVFRVLKKNGRMFHYIGDLNSNSGKRVTRGAHQRLLRAGFKRVIPCPDAFGLLAFKT
jgi:uncharacterized protein